MKHLTFFYILLILCAPRTLCAQYSPQFGGAVAVNDGQVFVGEGNQLLLPGNVLVYHQTEDGQWNLQQVLSPDSEDALGFGRHLASIGNTLVIGAPLTHEIYVYTRSENATWSLSQTLTQPHTSLALTEDYLLIGAPEDRDAKGAAYLYSRNEHETWDMANEFSLEDTSRSQYAGAVAIHGNDFIVSMPQSESGKGRVYIYSEDVQEITLPDGETGDLFGASVASAGDVLAIGAPGRKGGVVTLFSKDHTTGYWNQKTTVSAPNTDVDQRFGYALAGGIDQLWISAPHFNERGGALYHMELDSMKLSDVLRPNELQFRSEFGTSLATDGTITVAGAVGQHNYEGAVFPLSLTKEGVQFGSPLFNLTSEIGSITGNLTECENGTAGVFPCAEVDMISFLTRQEIGALQGIQVSDVWGWEDPETGHEYALVGRTDGTSFIDLTDPSHPVYLGNLPKTATADQSLWRDIKVYKDHAFIVADGAGAHHMQVFDLTQLRGITEPQIFTESAIYKEIFSSHNIVINEESGFAYAVGSRSGGETCGGALHMINIQDPLRPTFAGCFIDERTSSTHDAQCVIYDGPDLDYQGREICLSSNIDALSIADVTNKEDPVPLSVARYPSVIYTHQGWLTEDHRYFYLNDEGDETAEVVEATRTLIFDVTDLEDPVLVKEYFGPSSAIDHNLYIRGDIMYQSNYVEGLRILDISDPENPIEVGHFDTVPYGPNSNVPVIGSWSNYPYFKSGTIVVTSGREGVFFLKRRPIDM